MPIAQYLILASEFNPGMEADLSTQQFWSEFPENEPEHRSGLFKKRTRTPFQFNSNSVDRGLVICELRTGNMRTNMRTRSLIELFVSVT